MKNHSEKLPLARLMHCGVFLKGTRLMAVRYSLNKTKFLLPPELDQLRSVLRKFIDQDARNCHLLELALRTGARATEILNLTQADLNAYDQSILIRGIKGSNDREIPLSKDYFLKLQTFAQASKGSVIFDIGYHRLHQVWDFYRPVPKKFHALRHTFAIELFRKTKDLRLVQVALGHRNITNTMIYADYVYSKQELRRLILD